MSAADDVLVVERHDAILSLRINRPQARNALTLPVMDGIGAAVLDAENDPGIRVILLSGTGDRAFCAGMDLRAFADGASMNEGSPEMVAYARLRAGELALPVVGAANGSAVGGGLELLLASDVIVASSTASFGLPEVKRGLIPGGGGTFLGSKIPLAVALEMTLTGDPVDAARARELGLVNAVVPPERVQEAALELAGRIAANAPLSLAACKELVRLGVSDAAAANERLGYWRTAVFSSADAKEGALAFMEKRAPNWQGR